MQPDMETGDTGRTEPQRAAVIDEIVERMKALGLPDDAGYVVEAPIHEEGNLDALLEAVDAAGIEYTTLSWWLDPEGVEALAVREMTPDDLELLEGEFDDDVADAIQERLVGLEAEPGQCFLVGGPFPIRQGALELTERRVKGVRLAGVQDEESPGGWSDDIVVMRVNPAVFDAVAGLDHRA